MLNSNNHSIKRSSAWIHSKRSSNISYGIIPYSIMFDIMTPTITTFTAHQVSGEQLIKYINNGLQDFIEDVLECNQVYFSSYLTEKIIADDKGNKVPFDNFDRNESADYVLTQSQSFPAEEFLEAGIDGKCTQQRITNFCYNFY